MTSGVAASSSGRKTLIFLDDGTPVFVDLWESSERRAHSIMDGSHTERLSDERTTAPRHALFVAEDRLMRSEQTFYHVWCFCVLDRENIPMVSSLSEAWSGYAAHLDYQGFPEHAEAARGEAVVAGLASPPPTDRKWGSW